MSLRQNTEEKKTREGVKSDVGRLERMKHGSGIKGRDFKWLIIILVVILV